MADYIPSDDASLLQFAQTFDTSFQDVYSSLGLVAGDATAMTAAITNFQTRVNDAQTARNAVTVATQVKNSARQALVEKLRMYSRMAQASPALVEADLLALGLPIRDTTPTAVAAPTSQPVLFVETGNRLEHTIRFRDSANPLSKAKPAGVLGCEIFRKIGGAAPASVAECEFLGLDSATPYVAQYDAVHGGEMVHYIGRWANRNGLVSPISDVISATVVA